MFKRISPHASFALAAGLALLAVQSALALTSAPVVVSGDGVTGVKVVRNDEPVTTKSTSYSAVQASRTTIQVPDGTNALILARFTGESVCYGGAANNWCTARIMVGGNQAQPSGDDVAFDSTDNGAESRHSWESHSIERVRGPLGPGSYQVEVQVKTSSPAVTFRLDDWTLVIERVVTT